MKCMAVNSAVRTKAQHCASATMQHPRILKSPSQSKPKSLHNQEQCINTIQFTQQHTYCAATCDSAPLVEKTLHYESFPAAIAQSNTSFLCLLHKLVPSASSCSRNTMSNNTTFTVPMISMHHMHPDDFWL